jgi:methyl-accepting chemotaxis protein
LEHAFEQVAASAQDVAERSRQTRGAAQDGGTAVQATTAAMREIQAVVGQAAEKVQELGRLGEKIGAVVQTIDEIAEQDEPAGAQRGNRSGARGRAR